MPTPKDKIRIGVTLSKPLAEGVADASGAVKPGRWLSMLIGDVMRRTRGLESEESAKAQRNAVTLESLERHEDG